MQKLLNVNQFQEKGHWENLPQTISSNHVPRFSALLTNLLLGALNVKHFFLSANMITLTGKIHTFTNDSRTKSQKTKSQRTKSQMAKVKTDKSEMQKVESKKSKKSKPNLT